MKTWVTYVCCYTISVTRNPYDHYAFNILCTYLRSRQWSGKRNNDRFDISTYVHILYDFVISEFFGNLFFGFVKKITVWNDLSRGIFVNPVVRRLKNKFTLSQPPERRSIIPNKSLYAVCMINRSTNRTYI